MKKPEPDSAETEEIRGVVTRVVFHADDTGYTVCAIRPSSSGKSAPASRSLPRLSESEDTSGEITVVGDCAAVWVGENLKATGRWTRHSKHGYQFQADQITCVAPVTTEGIRMYLASGMISGIGEVMAERLVKAFGEETLNVIDKESKRLTEVPGIGPKTRAKIKDSWNAQKAVRDIMIFLRGHGVGTAQAARIYRQYGDEAVAIVTQDPYRLCRDVWGIGFKSADEIAMSLGVPRDSDIRARAAVLHVLQTMADDGHCFCPVETLIEEGQSLLGIPSQTLAAAVAHETGNNTIVEEDGNTYLAPLYYAEVDIARKLRQMLKTDSAFRPIAADKAVEWAEKRMKISFAPAQTEALKMALSEKVSIITGGPGVGKTTIMRALVDVFRARNLTVSLAAPTGRAAKRLSEATRFTAMTLHRLLKFLPMLGTFEHGPGKPLPGEIFILDEVSMIDTPLMHCFLNALTDASHLILVGDSDQLPSVGPGNILRDLVGSGAISCKRLDTIFRQHSRSWIVHNAHRVNNGEPLEFPPSDSDADFYFIRADEPEDVIKRMLDLVTTRIPRRFRLNARTDIQVLTPMRRNQLGSENLNAVLQEALNPSGVSLNRFGRIYRIGDRVMQIRNNYDKEVFNGDIGVISAIDENEHTVAVSFDGRMISYDYSEIDELMLAYACSIHKSQGSEYPAVVILMATQHFKLLQRNLLYTALTRGRKLVCLIGSHKAVNMAIRNNRTTLRRTSLARRLCSTPGRASAHERRRSS